MDPSVALLIGAGILIIGFIADMVHDKFGIPAILVLIFLGALFGPILQILPREPLITLAPYFAALTLAIVLFEAGISFPSSRGLSEAPRALLYAFFTISFSTLFTAIALMIILNLSPLEAALLGVTVGGTSSAVIIPLVSRMKVSSFARNMLTFESVLTDGLVIVVAMLLLRLIALPGSAITPEMISREIIGALVISAIVGVAAAFLVAKLIPSIHGRVYGDILILGLLIFVYAASEQVGGSGALTAFISGIALRNITLLSSWGAALKGSHEPGVREAEAGSGSRPLSLGWYSKRFYAQLSFLMRTYFFAFLGMIFYAPNLTMCLIGFFLTALLIFARAISTTIICFRTDASEIDRFSMSFLCARGLSAAVLASILTTYNLSLSGIAEQLIAQVIIYTSVISAAAAYVTGSTRFRRIFS
ncbi:cation:proton antiporter [Candidatus Bathyarchaeota archaeon]|nr:cation:proton antiporter [Candidatus Bathyarchaeota archaeon]